MARTKASSAPVYPNIYIGTDADNHKVWMDNESLVQNGLLVLGRKNSGKSELMAKVLAQVSTYTEEEKDGKHSHLTEAGFTVITSRRDREFQLMSMLRKLQRKSFQILSPSANFAVKDTLLGMSQYSYDAIKNIIDYEEAINRKTCVMINMENPRYEGMSVEAVGMLLMQLQIAMHNTARTGRRRHYLFIEDAAPYLPYLQSILEYGVDYNVCTILSLTSRSEMGEYVSLLDRNIQNVVLTGPMFRDDAEYYAREFNVSDSTLQSFPAGKGTVCSYGMNMERTITPCTFRKWFLNEQLDSKIPTSAETIKKEYVRAGKDEELVSDAMQRYAKYVIAQNHKVDYGTSLDMMQDILANENDTMLGISIEPPASITRNNGNSRKEKSDLVNTPLSHPKGGGGCSTGMGGRERRDESPPTISSIPLRTSEDDAEPKEKEREITPLSHSSDTPVINGDDSSAPTKTQTASQTTTIEKFDEDCIRHGGIPIASPTGPKKKSRDLAQWKDEQASLLRLIDGSCDRVRHKLEEAGIDRGEVEKAMQDTVSEMSLIPAPVGTGGELGIRAVFQPIPQQTPNKKPHSTYHKKNPRKKPLKKVYTSEMNGGSQRPQNSAISTYSKTRSKGELKKSQHGYFKKEDSSYISRNGSRCLFQNLHAPSVDTQPYLVELKQKKTEVARHEIDRISPEMNKDDLSFTEEVQEEEVSMSSEEVIKKDMPDKIVSMTETESSLDAQEVEQKYTEENIDEKLVVEARRRNDNKIYNGECDIANSEHIYEASMENEEDFDIFGDDDGVVLLEPLLAGLSSRPGSYISNDRSASERFLENLYCSKKRPGFFEAPDPASKEISAVERSFIEKYRRSGQW